MNKRGWKNAIDKKAEMQLSFGMIFSIIIIIFILVLAFYVIKFVIGWGESAKVTTFIDELRTETDKLWKGPQGSQKFESVLPTKIDYACFVDFSSNSRGNKKEIYSDLELKNYENENLVFYPIGSAKGLESVEIKYLDIEKITSDNNPYCVENDNGKISIMLKKNFGENLITLT